MKVRTALIVTGLAAVAAAAWIVTTAAATPADDPTETGTVVITPVTGDTPDGSQRTPPPGAATTDPDFEAGMDQPAQDADGTTVPPTVTVLGRG